MRRVTNSLTNSLESIGERRTPRPVIYGGVFRRSSNLPHNVALADRVTNNVEFDV